MKNISYFLILFAIFFTSCQEVIEIDLNEAKPTLVIEANINDDMGAPFSALVQITKTTDYFSPDTPEFVTGAVVLVKDDLGKVDSLQEFFPGFYTNPMLRGISGRTYTLEVRYDNQVYTATSKMASVVNIDSVWSEKPPRPPGAPVDVDTIRVVSCKFNDPVEKNYYRLIAELPNGDRNSFFSAGNYYLLDDQFRNGQEYEYTFRGATFGVGDTVNIELRAIDEPIYKYFDVLSQIAGFGAAASSAPGNPESNISGGALGYFSAYSVKKTIFIIAE